MKYISTRGKAPKLAFDDVLLTGLARDGGLYLPESWPTFTRDEIRAMQNLPYDELAIRVMAPFIGDAIAPDDFAAIVRATYANFDHPAIAPMKQLGPSHWVMELFHGPTFAFKDYALQLAGRLFDHVLHARGESVTIVGATSGDTGSAAIEACRDRDAMEIFILFPHGRVSEVQRRQMSTVESDNVHVIAVEGTFDDCQDMVKAMFNDHDYRDELRLSAVNSINWARIMAQIVYYFYAALAVGAPDRKVAFAVPTGNFGNVFAGFAATKMGLPVENFIVSSNRNDILTRYLTTGEMKMEPVEPSLSPSMDIQISSNFERLLSTFYPADGVELTQALADFRANGAVSFGDARWQAICEKFVGYRLGDDETQAVIKRVFETTGEVLDPHSAIGVAAGEALPGDADVAMISLATAHPAKFPDAVQRATGQRPPRPERLAQMFVKPERVTILHNDIDVIKAHIQTILKKRASA